MARGLVWCVVSACVAAACGGGGIFAPRPGGTSGSTDKLLLISTALDQPVFLTAPAGDNTRLFVVERTGRIRVFHGDTLRTTPFLDLSAQVDTANVEQGLLGLAFHPDYLVNCQFFVSYTDTAGDTRIVRYAVSANADVADPASGDTILAVDQPFDNHNGGMIAYGPDGFLYVGLGDGGDAGDPDGNGQDLATLLGKILRIDPDGGIPYGIPGTNPFVSTAGARGEIWALGLRNPWRFSFDRGTGDLYIGDVGQATWEEIDYQVALAAGGANYGWRVMEGPDCFGAANCDRTGLTLPIHAYPTSEGCAVVGGYVYRGTAVTALAGQYVYSDNCAGFIRTFEVAGGVDGNHRVRTGTFTPGTGVTSFGEDGDGDLYVMTLSGKLFRFVPGS